MDVIKEMQEMRAMKAQVEELAKQGMDPKGLSQKMHLPKKEGESDLSWKTRVLTLSYASDFIDGAEAKDIQLTFQPEEAEAVAQAVGAAYEYNLVNREVGHKDNQVLVSKQLGCYLALTLCHAREGKLVVKTVPAIPVTGLTSLLVSGMVLTVSLPKFREVNPIEVANKVVKTMRVTDEGLLSYKKSAIINLLTG